MSFVDKTVRLRAITIGFSKPINRFFPIFNWLIRWYEKTPYSHVFILYDENKIIEATGAGVEKDKDLETWEKKSEIIIQKQIEITEEAYQLILNYKKVKHYGYLQIIGLVLAKAFRLNWNIFPNDKICSELVAEVLELSGYKINKNKNLVTPKDIYEIIAII